MKKRIVVVDDHASIRDMLIWILLRESCYDIIGQAGSGIEAIKVCGTCRPDLVILDLLLPRLSGVEVLRRLRRDLPQTRVLIFSGTCNGAMMKQALRERPHGYVGKLDSLQVLKQAISTITSGGSYFVPAAAGELHSARLAGEEETHLSPREREVLQMVAEGWSSKQISRFLNLAVKTVENHRANLMAKLGMHDVASLTRYAVGRGMVAVELESI